MEPGSSDTAVRQNSSTQVPRRPGSRSPPLSPAPGSSEYLGATSTKSAPPFTPRNASSARALASSPGGSIVEVVATLHLAQRGLRSRHDQPPLFIRPPPFGECDRVTDGQLVLGVCRVERFQGRFVES